MDGTICGGNFMVVNIKARDSLGDQNVSELHLTTPCSRVLEKLIVAQLSINSPLAISPFFLEPEISLPCLHGLFTKSYPEPVNSNILYIFNNILTPDFFSQCFPAP
jgi:hypothetical protein